MSEPFKHDRTDGSRPELFLVPQNAVVEPGQNKNQNNDNSGDGDDRVGGGDDGGFRSFTLVDGQHDPETLSGSQSGVGVVDRDVVPGWVRSSDALRSVVRGWVVGCLRVVLFHLLRSHVYVFRLLWRCRVGFWQLLKAWFRWVRDADYSQDRELLAANGGQVLDLKRAHHSTIRTRLRISGVVALFGFIAVLVAFAVLPPVVFGLLVLVVLCGVGAGARPTSGVPVIERASYKAHQSPRFSESLLLEALRRCGAEPKGARPIQVIQPPVKIRSGWEAIVSVGVNATSVIEKRSLFAAVLDRPASCVWLTSDVEESASWLRVVVTRKSLRRTTVPAWPFLKGGSFNYFTDEVPIGIDVTGVPIGGSKAYRSTVGGGLMGSGKTVSMITGVVGLAVDPRVEIHVNDLKGGTDWEPLAPIAHTYISGSDPAAQKAARANLEELNRRMDNRFTQLKNLPAELASPKTNDQLASMRHLDLHPIVIVIDETQEFFEFADDAKVFEALISRLVKRGRAVGITVEAATQEVTKKTLPIAGLCHWRLCHSVQGHGPVDLILGTGAHHAGFNADALTADDVGIGYFGSGKEIRLFKSYYIDPDNGDLDRVVERLRTERERLDRLTGQAAGNQPEDNTHQDSTLELVARVWPDGQKRLQWVELVDLLHAVAPADYPRVTSLNPPSAGVTKAAQSLSAQLLKDGVVSKSVRSRFHPKAGNTSEVRKGAAWEDIEAVLGEPDTTKVNAPDAGDTNSWTPDSEEVDGEEVDTDSWTSDCEEVDTDLAHGLDSTLDDDYPGGER